MRLRREQDETVDGLADGRKALAELYIDGGEERRRERLAAEAAERGWAERLDAALVARLSEEEADRAMTVRRAELDDQADRDLQAELDSHTELASRTAPGTDSSAMTESAADAGSEPEYGDQDLSEDPAILQVERLRALSTVADLLVEIADTVRTEEGPAGRLPYQTEQSRLPILRGRLAIALATARLLRAPDLDACRKVVEAPPNFASQALAGVLEAIDEVRDTLTSGSQLAVIRPLRPAGTKQTQSGERKKRKKKKSQTTADQASPHDPLPMPKRVTQGWIEAHVPTMSAAELGEFVSDLKKRNWSDSDIASRVIPYASE
jgi:hypothetical protein